MLAKVYRARLSLRRPGDRLRLLSFAALAIALVLLPTAFAVRSGAEVFPEMAVPGMEVTMVYLVETTATAEVAISESASCVLSGPAGEAIDCGAIGSLVDVRVSTTQRAYTFTIIAPTVVGNYTATFARQAVVGLELPPGGDSAATVVFEVVEEAIEPALEPDAPPPTNTTDDTPTNTTEPEPVPPVTEQVPPPAPATGDSLRWLWSLVMASGATCAAIALARFGGG